MRRRILHVRLDALRLPAGAAAPTEMKAKLTAALAAALAAKARGSAAEGPTSTGPELHRAAEIIAARIGPVHGRPQ